MGDGWRIDFKQTHFDAYSPPDFYTKVPVFLLLHDKSIDFPIIIVLKDV